MSIPLSQFDNVSTVDAIAALPPTHHAFHAFSWFAHSTPEFRPQLAKLLQ